MHLYLIRHALPDYTQSGAYHRPPGPPLTDAGRAQAQTLAALLRGANIERLASSPLQRSRLTVEPLAQLLNLDIETDDDLIDMQPGEKPAEMSLRLMRAVLSRSKSEVVALCSHAAPLENLLKTLTRDTIQLPAPDRRGCQVAEGSVWRAVLNEGRWHVRQLPTEGFQA